MDAEWIKSPTARRVLTHFAGNRPAWLWSKDGANLLWRNPAARLFYARIKKSGLRLAGEAVPIKGQVARLIRLGSPGRSSLSRVQFLAGDRPLAETCSCTPVLLKDGEPALLLVAIDPVPADVREAAGDLVVDAMSEALFPAVSDYLVVQAGRPVAGSTAGLGQIWPEIERTAMPEENSTLTRFVAEDGAELMVWAAGDEPATRIEEVRAEEGEGALESETRAVPAERKMTEPLLPMGLEAAPQEDAPRAAADEPWGEPIPALREHALLSLFDRLADDATLYTELTSADETLGGAGPTPVPELATAETEPAVANPEVPDASQGEAAIESAPPEAEKTETVSTTAADLPADDLIAAVIEYADDPEEPVPSPGTAKSHWMITGRGFRALTPKPPTETDDTPAAQDEDVTASMAAAVETPTSTEPEASSVGEDPTTSLEPAREETVAIVDASMPIETVDEAPDAETAERVSRYNFEELSRILTDRVAAEPRSEPSAAPAPTQVRPEGVINLNAETLVLNRLPLAIMVFRDQQVLFANRALTDLLGHDSVESLRGAGIGSIFPNPDSASAGPVNQLLRSDNTLLPVTARLQSVSWQGRSALMLSATPGEPMRSHEVAIRGFAELAAEAREEGFIAADRNGRVTQLSGTGKALLDLTDGDPLGKPLAALVAKADMDPLRDFLEKPARFAETARPVLTAMSEDGGAEIVLFAEGQAGIVTGYFGFVRGRLAAASPTAANGEAEPPMLARLSRGVRRPLNTIIGFADLIRSAALGQLDSERYAEYARDIRTAGLEIAVLVDELDDLTRISEGRYAARPSDVDLAALLENCMMRVKAQAGAARVLVRSAISEQLPRIHADRTSLTQALLNLLASAIDQTPIGGSVILSAQLEEDGGVAIHVRDGAQSTTDIAERFVVFRDGLDKDGEELTPVRSSVGLALTRSLLAVNACSLSVDPMMGAGTLFSLIIPVDLVARG